MKNFKSIHLSLICSFLAISLFTINLFAQTVPPNFKSQKAFAQKVMTLDGEEKMLRELAGSKGTMLVFSCNTCPFVIAWEDRYNELAAICKANGINMILVNSNEAERDGDDAPSAMKAHAEELKYTMPYVIDTDHVIADMLEAKTTPHVYLFNSNFEIVYQGAIDDDHKNKDEVKETYAADAAKALGNGESIANSRTKALGCSIKRKKS